MAEVDIVTDALICCPVDEVSAYAMDPTNAPIWYENIRSVEYRTPPPLEVGSEVAFVARFLGRRLSYTYQVVELVPSQRLVMRTTEGPFPMETIYEFEASGPEWTRVRLRNRGTPTGFSRLVAPFLVLAMKRENRKDLARLKAVLEQHRSQRME